MPVALTAADIRAAKWRLDGPNQEHRLAFAALGLDVTHPRWDKNYLNESCEWFAGMIRPVFDGRSLEWGAINHITLVEGQFYWSKDL